ncbi:hypothetical protein [Wenyingzhuangia sp. IMCC45574]
MKSEDKQKLNEIIRDKYWVSYMTDGKWYKLALALTEQLEEVFVLYKLVYNDELAFTSIKHPASKTNFMGTIAYKEVEWIEFPKEFVLETGYIEDLDLPFDEEHSQDVSLIEKIIKNTGTYNFERKVNSVKLFAYR